jgi:hypothetical protein
MSLLDKCVTKADDGTWTFQCPGVKGDRCAPIDGDAPGWRSSGWPTKKLALARGREHFDEHRGLGAASSLEEFRAKHGLVVDDQTGAVTLADLED